MKTMEYWKKGADLHDPDCLCGLGYLYEAKVKSETSAYRAATHYHEKAAKLGSANSSNQLGLLYETGKGVEKNGLLAAQYFHHAMNLENVNQKSSFSGNPVYSFAALNLARLYAQEDQHFPKDERQAEHWFRVSAAAGHKDAQEVLRRMGLSELNSPQKLTFFFPPEADAPKKILLKDPTQLLLLLNDAVPDTFTGIRNEHCFVDAIATLTTDEQERKAQQIKKQLPNAM